METGQVNRREFTQSYVTVTSAFRPSSDALTSAPAASVTTTTKRTAVDQVTLGSTGIKLSRLGLGMGSNNGYTQTALGRQGFNDLVKYAYEQGITYFDCAQAYQTFEWLGAAIKPLPREKLFVQSKIDVPPENTLAAIDHHRKVYDTDYLDSLLIHCMVRNDWTDQWKMVMDGFDEAKSRGWIKSKGVSCHSLPALSAATAHPWPEVHLVRVNPQGRRIDGMEEVMWLAKDRSQPIAPVLTLVQDMKARGRGVIGMKICGNGEFLTANDREISIRFAMSLPELDAVVIGFKSRAEIDEAIQLMNGALAES